MENILKAKGLLCTPGWKPAKLAVGLSAACWLAPAAPKPWNGTCGDAAPACLWSEAPNRKLGGVTAAGEAAAAAAAAAAEAVAEAAAEAAAVGLASGLTPMFGGPELAEGAAGSVAVLETASLKAKEAEGAWRLMKGLAGTAIWGKPMLALAAPAGKGAPAGCVVVEWLWGAAAVGDIPDRDAEPESMCML